MLELCLSASAMYMFVSLLDPEIIEIQAPNIIIHAEEGPVEWVWVDRFDSFVYNGDISSCVDDTAI